MCRCSQVRNETSRLLTHTQAFETHGLKPGLPVTPCPAAWCVPPSVRLQGALSCEAVPAGGPGWQPPALLSPARRYTGTSTQQCNLLGCSMLYRLYARIAKQLQRHAYGSRSFLWSSWWVLKWTDDALCARFPRECAEPPDSTAAWI